MADRDCLKDKNKLRRRMKTRLETVSNNESYCSGKRIWEIVFKDIIPQLQVAEDARICVGLYYPIAGEPNIFNVYREEKKYNICCVFPVINNMKMVYYRPRDEHDFVAGPLGIHQPSEKAQQVHPLDMDILLVPGLAFDKKKNRLGRGKGYYDRFLSEYRSDKSPLFVGVCHSFQIQNIITTQPHDIKLDYIVSPKGLI